MLPSFIPTMGVLLALTTAAADPLSLREGEVELMRAPAPGSSRSTAIETRLTLDGGELSCIMDGNDVPAAYLPELRLELTEVRALDIGETFEQDSWLRRYKEVSWKNDGSMNMTPAGASELSFPWSVEAATPIEGRVVRLAQDSDGSIGRSFADDGHGDEKLLEGLCADLGLGALTVGEPVAPGANWTVDGAELALLFDPCGNLQWDLPPDADSRMLPEIRERTAAGELVVTLRRVTDDGTRAHCTVKGELTRTTVQPGDLSSVPVAEGDATDTVHETWEVEGEFAWDLASNAVLTLKLTGSFLQRTRTVKDAGQPGSSYESTFSVEGDYEVRFDSDDVDN